MYEYHYNAVAYDFNFVVYIATRTFTDATIIIEQIAPMFRPDITIKIQELDIQEIPTSIPVAIGDFSIDLPEDIGEDEIRIIQIDFPLILKGNLYLPIKDKGVISEIEVNMDIIETQRDEAAEKFGIDYPSETEVEAAKITNTPAYNPDSTEEIPQAQEDSILSSEHYENSLPTGDD